jgi:hypothetical protein
MMIESEDQNEANGAGKPPLSVPYERFQIQVDGQTVVGEITHRANRDIAVRIVKPYQYLSSSCHIPLFALSMGRITFIGERGDDTARRLLRECYRLGQFLEANLQQLIDAWAEHQEVAEKTRPEKVDPADFMAKKKALKSAMNSGEITSIEYQRALAELKDSHIADAVLGWASTRGFLKKHFPEEMVHTCPEHELIEIMEGVCLLS